MHSLVSIAVFILEMNKERVQCVSILLIYQAVSLKMFLEYLLWTSHKEQTVSERGQAPLLLCGCITPLLRGTVSKQVDREGGTGDGNTQDTVARAHAGDGLLCRVGGLQSHF